MAAQKTTAKTAEATEVVEVVETKPVKQEEVKKTKVEVDRNQLVECKNVTNGSLTYISRNGYVAEWGNFGDVEYLPVSELMTMKASQGRFLNEPWLIIEDEEVAQFLGLKKVYERIVAADEITALFSKSPKEIEEILATAPKGTKDLVADKAREMVANETLYDTRIMKVLDKALNIDLKMFQD
ncbi:hypothetical protein MKY96_33170 [Paenibacillus sp. FSL R7-0302]|uniref:hypothetical protein n=1 Tax=Paenibacillus sp. FSL R7-0302 TaxID=2921681 RepID=UPI0030F6E67F